MNTKPKKEINLLAVVGAVLAVVVLVAGIFIWCGHNSKMAKKAMAEKDFEAAIAYCEKDFISGSKLIPEIRYEQACELYNAGEYEASAEIFLELGATADWEDAQYMLGLTMLQQGRTQEAVAAFENSGEQGFDMWLESKSLLAYELYFDGDTQGAIAMLEPLAEHKVIDKTLTDLKISAIWDAVHDKDSATVERYIAELGSRLKLNQKEYNGINYFRGVEALRSKDYKAAVEHFERCTDTTDKEYGRVFRMLQANKIMDAAQLVGSLNGATLPFELDSSWIKIFREFTGGNPETNMEDWLTDTAVQKLLSYDKEYVMTNTYMQFGDLSFMEAEDYIGAIEDDDKAWAVSDIDALRAKCGTDPKGKVLILRKQYSYPKGETYYAVDKWLMGYLYPELFPGDLSEVEYILTVTYDYGNAGSYIRTTTFGSNTTKEYVTFLRTKAMVELVHLTDNKTVHKSQWIQGGNEPSAYSGEDKWISGNMPEPADQIITAIEKLRTQK